MDEKLLGEATKYIDAVASKLGVAGEHVYGLLVKQAMIGGVMNLVVAVILLGVAYALVRLTKWLFSSGKAFSSDSTPLGIFSGFFALITLFLGLDCAYTGVGALINPEYYAIKEILDAFNQ